MKQTRPGGSPGLALFTLSITKIHPPLMIQTPIKVSVDFASLICYDGSEECAFFGKAAGKTGDIFLSYLLG
jgi:hypothetical protein